MIRTPRAHLNVEAQTHPGMTGKNNEDRYAVASFVLGRKNRMPVLFAVLADGIGGHRNVHVIRRYLGSPTPPDPDFRMKLSKDEGDQHAENNQGVQLLPNDVLLLCSDGLTDLVWNDEILEVIRSKPSLKETARALI